jgi:hypothetical protein
MTVNDYTSNYYNDHIPLCSIFSNNDTQNRMSSDLVISGKVINVSKVEYKQNHPISMHDPNWNEATIQIEGVEKGTYDGNEIKVLFSSSIDIARVCSPKLYKGTEGIFILHTEHIPQLNGEEAYIIINETDFQPNGKVS